MLNPSIGVLIQNNESRYKLVLDVASEKTGVNEEKKTEDKKKR